MPDDVRIPVESHDPTPSAPPLAELSPHAHSLHLASLPIALQIFFDATLFERCKEVARYLAKAEGYAPRHLIGKPEACFAVVSRALTWRLDPYAVAQACYQTPGGQIGYYGSLCQAILENSGRLVGGVKFEHYGDWSRLRGKFKIVNGANGKHPARDWADELEDGLGVLVSARLKDEDERRELPFDLVQAFPRNSTLWATDPRTQIMYTAVRRFATSTVPNLFMGVPFDYESEEWAALKDVTPATPRPRLEEFTASPPGEEATKPAADATPRRGRGRPRTEPRGEPAAEPVGSSTASPADPSEGDKPYCFADRDGEVHEFAGFEDAVAAYADVLAAVDSVDALEAAWENGTQLVQVLRDKQHGSAVDALVKQYAELRAAFEPEEDAPEDASNEAAKINTASAAYDIAVPMTGTAQAWFQPARAKLREMTAAGRPPVDFRRYRETNATGLAALKKTMSAWYGMLDKAISAGEAGLPPQS